MKREWQQQCAMQSQWSVFLEALISMYHSMNEKCSSFWILAVFSCLIALYIIIFNPIRSVYRKRWYCLCCWSCFVDRSLIGTATATAAAAITIYTFKLYAYLHLYSHPTFMILWMCSVHSARSFVQSSILSFNK